MDNRKKVVPLAMDRDAAFPAVIGMAAIAAIAVAAARLLPLVLGS